MKLDSNRTRRHLNGFDFKNLFLEELLWDDLAGSSAVRIGEQAIPLERIAQKRGVQIFHCQLSELPDRPTRQKIERTLAKQAAEHLIIFSDTAHTVQVWQWVKREPGQPDAYREHTYHVGQNDAALLERLKGIVFDIGEEDGITLTDVTVKLRDAFDKDKVSKKFYDTFKKEHQAFLDFVEGIQKMGDREWYASVMLNRLMFIYFIQKKGFLDGDRDYLQNRLRQTKAQAKDKFHTFYRYFLLRLFHDGLGGKDRDPDLKALIGKVPYLNGGLFDVHQLERDYANINIPDEAFERIFAFFDQYDWYLDDRPMRQEREINPDVIGYIFEKYINQKQMGAYYTKEDITEYISKNTIVPFLLESAQKGCKVAFGGEHSVWRLLQDDPERYIYPAVKHGTDLELPSEIAAGVNDVSQRDAWNTPAPDKYALTTEIWREVVARRERYFEVKEKLERGEVKSPSDLITYNLNIRQFMQDVIEQAESPELVRAIYYTLAGRVPKPGSNAKHRNGISVLDPTCGSGAFLFAALGVLKPLYEACLGRMESFIEDAARSSDASDKRYSDFRDILHEAESHPNRDYFVLKTIILNNLYGVDIMPEAVEIAKLRLFLKLAAQVEPNSSKRNYGIEPLPDIDFNIRAGNTLVGYASKEEVKKAVTSEGDQGKIIFGETQDALTRIEEKASAVSRLFRLFRQQQTIGATDSDDTAATKQDLRNRLDTLREELDAHLAREYGKDPKKTAEYTKWLESHQPFHWYTEFYEIMSEEGNGGFDVIIGNPPWKEYSSVRKTYRLHNYTTLSSGNLYGICIERCLNLLSPSGYFSFVVQLPLVSSSRMTSVRQVLREKASFISVVPFDDRPGRLFDGLEHCRSTIFVCKVDRNRHTASLYTTRYQRWTTETRNVIFATLKFVAVSENSQIHPELFPKQGDEPLAQILCKVRSVGESKIADFVRQATTKHFIFYQEAMQYWAKVTVGLPYYAKNGAVGAPAHGRFSYFDDEVTAYCVGAILNSSLFYLYFLAYSDGFHLSQGIVSDFPVREQILKDNSLAQLSRKLMTDLTRKADTKTITTRAGDSISYAQFYGSKSKPVMDEIDHALARHYGFTPEETDFIVSYDIKYRMGDALFNGDGD